MAAYNAGEVTTTEALIRAGLSGRAAKLAYRFPRLFGHLCPLAAADRLRPIYAPKEGWRTVGHQSPPSLRFEGSDLGHRFGSGPDWSEEDFPGH
jgi:hypothetical protein